MQVVSLTKHMSRDTVQLLESVLAVAYEEGGSVLLAYRSPRGEKRVAFTGIYAKDTSQALRAIMQMSVHVTGIEEHVRGKP